ncbi:hypothetical protein SAY86_009202 [Trapa natans]|uniref:Uncharacterized protein n=1 Tax=Trapa natans TaxID=22666 RepID=A0AAN7KVM4_TRANT|nr:hypothetical protein SAY86_009202 [Trapa natans]
MELYWYDFFCVGLVAAASIGSLCVLWREEGRDRAGDDDDDRKLRKSLLAVGGQVDHSWLWASCWRGVHPGWLLAIRVGSFAVLGGFLAWDIVEWDPTIFVYYTEWTFTLVMIYFALGSILSVYGCWVYATKPASTNRYVNEPPTSDLEESDYTSFNTYREREFQRSKLGNQYTEEYILQRAGFCGYLMQIAYQTSAGAVILTDIVFWCVIVPFMSNARLSLNLVSSSASHTVFTVPKGEC